jgi:hypothetical protein
MSCTKLSLRRVRRFVLSEHLQVAGKSKYRDQRQRPGKPDDSDSILKFDWMHRTSTTLSVERKEGEIKVRVT